MALQVWLPLNENLENHGLSNIDFTSSISGSFTLNNSGKIGKCYAGYLLKHLSTDFLENKWTICLWVNNTRTWSATNDILLCKNISASTSCQFYMSIINANTFNIGVNAGSSTTSYSYTFNVNTWYHLAVSFDGSYIYMYINGTLVKSVANTSTQLTGHLNLGIGCISTNANGTTSTGGHSTKLFNDVRIYNHCLSTKEIHEISQGLVLHYKLDTFEYNNLLPTGVELYDYIESTGTQWIDTGIYGYMNHKYVLDYQQIGTGNYRVWGVFGQSSYIGYNMSITYAGGRCIRWSSTSNGTNLIDNIDTISNTDRHTFIIDNGQIYYDGVNKGKSSGHSDSCVINYPLYLFTVNPANTTPTYNSVVRIYSYKDYDSSGNLIRNMVPCTYFGEPGMWDTVENKFYRNQGTGTFTLGTKIILKEYEYLQSSGTQWIDTNQLGNNTTDIELKYSYDALATSIGMLGYGQGSTTEPMNGFRLYYAGSNKFYISCYSRLNASTLPSNITFSTQTIYTTFFKGSTGTVTTNNISNNVGNYGTGTNNTYPLVLFKPYTTCTKGKLYYCKIYNNNILIKDFVPVSYNNTPGLWDKVEWKFYANAGTGTFTLGSEKTQFNKIYDCSGYGNNGTITGTLTIDSNSLRYNSSILFNGQGLISTTASGPYILTMSIWSKDKGTIPSNGLMFKDHLGDMALGIQSNRLYSGKSGGRGAGSILISNINYITNTWHHWVMVNRDNTYYVYMDGQQVLSGTSGNWSAGSVTNALHIGGRSGSSPWPGSLSDFRAYATALSESDILKLYNNPAHIDNKNNLYGFEFDEKNITNPKILKRGIVEIDNFIEPIGYIYLPAGTYINTELNYANNDVCKAETVIKYESGGSGRDLMGYSASGGGYWGVTASGSWEPHGTFTYTNSDITKKNTIVYIFSSASEHGIYRVGVLNSSFSVRGKYIYRVKLYKNNILERDLYPIKVGNKVGLYDLITNRYYLANNENGDIFYEESNIKFFKKSITTNRLIEK